MASFLHQVQDYLAFSEVFCFKTMASCSEVVKMNDKFVEKKKKNESEMQNAGLRRGIGPSIPR